MHKVDASLAGLWTEIHCCSCDNVFNSMSSGAESLLDAANVDLTFYSRAAPVAHRPPASAVAKLCRPFRNSHSDTTAGAAPTRALS